MSDVALFRTYLYVPGSKPDVVEKAFNSHADCIVIDLEDAVHPDKKVDARNFVAEFIAAGATKPFLVRINNLESKWGKADLEAIALPGLAGIRIPKVESVDTVKQAADILNKVKSDAQIHLLIESAKGVGQLSALASSDPRVAAISLGEADLLSDLRATNDEALKFCRNALIVAARAAGLKQPSQSVYANTKDLVGLRESTVHAKETGFFGRSVIHPNQIETVNEVFTPTQQEYEKALEMLSVFEQIQKSGESVMALPNGEMIDPANIYHAQFLVKLFESNKR
jgi:citrate lyase subunit beta/citryl-CoA lyase